jgi:hypothetical protein
MTKQKIDASGKVGLSSQAAAAIGARPLEVVSYSPCHALLANTDGGQIIMAGSVGDVTVTDLLSFCNMFRKTGSILFTLKGGVKELFFAEGEIVFATSSYPHEALPEVLYDLGKINQATLKKIKEVSRGQTVPVGKILVEKEIITPKDLWLAARQQVEAIIYSLFSFQEGDFCLRDQEIDEDKIVRLSMNTQNLIMEGLRRVDERALYLREIPSMEAVPVLGNQRGQKLTDSEQKLVELIRDDNCNVKELLRLSGLGEFEGLQHLYQLIRKKIVTLEEPAVAEVKGDLGDLLSVFNGAMVAMARQISTVNAAFVEEVQIFIRDLPQPYSYVFRDVTVAKDGSVDGGRIMANLDGLEEGDKKRLLADALSEVVYMECIAAKENLPAEESADLIKRVQKVSERIKSLIGRGEG